MGRGAVRDVRLTAGAFLAAGIVLASPLPSEAEPASSQPASQPATRPVPATQASARTFPARALAQPAPELRLRPEKSRATATLLAVGLTVIPAGAGARLLHHALHGDSSAELYSGIVLLTLGAGFGPSAGHLYAGEYWNAGTRIAIRLAAGGVGAVFFCLYAEEVMSDALGCLFGCSHPVNNDAVRLEVGGFIFEALAAVVLLYDWWDAGRAVTRMDKRRLLHGARLIPILAGTSGTPQTGFALVGRF